jgi:hypothetical protein
MINALHCALGHVAQGAVQYVAKQGLIEGVKLNSASTPEFCEACTKAKAMRQPVTTRLVVIDFLISRCGIDQKGILEYGDEGE